MVKLVQKYASLILVLLWVAPLAAQTPDCPTIVKTAIDESSKACQGVQRNQACYGNIQLNATAQANAPALTFAKPGDLANLADIKSLTLSELNKDSGQWGIAMMRVQANLPDTLPGQNVTFVMFGNVSVDNAGGAAPAKAPTLLDVTAPKTVNLRSAPSRTAAVAGSLKGGTTVKADARLDDASWLRLQLDGGSSAWVLAQLVKVSGDVQTLDVVDPNASAVQTPQFGPMQAFYFKSGVGDAPCAQAPNSGLLVQTPSGDVKVNLQVNGVNITLGSTAYLEAQPGKEMAVNLVEGKSDVESGSVTRTLLPGTRVRVPIDANLQATGAPSPVEPYTASDVQALPVSLLPAAITVAQPLDLSTLNVTLPTNGLWKAEYHNPSQVVGKCIGGFGGMGGGGDGGGEIPPVPICGAKIAGKPLYIVVQNSTHPYELGSDNVFGGPRPLYYAPRYDSRMQTIGAVTTVDTDSYQVVSPSQIEFTYTSQETGGCTVTSRMTYALVTADESVCDPKQIASMIDQAENSQSHTYPAVQPGKYTVSDTTTISQCNPGDAPDFSNGVNVSVDANKTVTLDGGGSKFNLYPMGGGSYNYMSGVGGKQQVQLTLSSSSDGSLSFLFFLSDLKGGNCGEQITLKPAGS
jgi:hypothetical protein